MQTLTDRLGIYCKENGKQMPYGQHESLLGLAASVAVKNAGKEDCMQKTTAEIWVNSYSDDAVPIVDEVIKDYFTNRKKFRSAIRQGRNEPAVKYFNYDVEDYKAPAFEEALKKVGIEVCQNFVQKGIAQYKIPIERPVLLIKLGKTFQKQRWIQENQQRIKKNRQQQK